MRNSIKHVAFFICIHAVSSFEFCCLLFWFHKETGLLFPCEWRIYWAPWFLDFYSFHVIRPAKLCWCFLLKFVFSLLGFVKKMCKGIVWFHWILLISCTLEIELLYKKSWVVYFYVTPCILLIVGDVSSRACILVLQITVDVYPISVYTQLVFTLILAPACFYLSHKAVVILGKN